MPQTDFIASQSVTIGLLEVITRRGLNWATKNLHVEWWQWQGHSIAIEPRYLANIIAAATAAGLKVQVQ